MDETLFIKQINEKQTQAFCSLFDGFFNSLLYFATGYVERREVAEDIVQEVFVQVWEGKTFFYSYNSLKTFLYTSVRNACLDWLKHVQVERKYMRALYVEEEDKDLDYKIMREEIYRKLFVAIEELPERCREIFQYHMQGKSNEEIATLLNLSVLTVKTQKKKAMQYLRKRLTHLFFMALLLRII